MLPLCLTVITHRFPPIHQGPYTKLFSLDVFKGSNVHTPALFLYRKKNSKCPLFWYTYIRKTLSSFQRSIHVRTPLSARTPLTSCVMCYHSVLITLSSFQRSATFEDSNVHRPVYFYIEKNSKCPFFWYTYISLLSSSQTPVHLYTRTPNSVLKFCAILLIIKLSCVLATIFSPFFTGYYYLSCTAHWLLLSVMHSALAAIICHAHRSGCYYLPCTPKWLLLSAMHTEVAAIICHAHRSGGYYLPNDYLYVIT